MINQDKTIEIFCIVDDFYQEINQEIKKTSIIR